MNFDLIEHTFRCPYCNEPISVMLDPSEKKQQYVEDCEVCCNPIDINYEISDGSLVYFESRAAE